MAGTTVVHVQVDEDIKAQATETLAGLGLTVYEAIRMFLARVVAEQGMPFAVKVPNAETRAAVEEVRGMAKPRFAIGDALIHGLDEQKAARR